MNKIFLSILTFLFLSANSWAATYTATESGNDSADATWGGAGHPTSNDDVRVITGYTVTYDQGDSAVTWGNITINSGGKLTFPTGADSTLSFNSTAVLTINSGGELEYAPTAAYHTYIYWPQGASARYAFVWNDGAIVDGAAIERTNKKVNLDSDWTSGQTLYLTGDVTSDWAADDKFYIHENISYDSYQNDGHIYTVASVGAYDAGNDRTSITINEAAPAGITFTAIHATTGYQSSVINLWSNVEFGDPGVKPFSIYGYGSYTENIRVDNNQAVGNSLINWAGLKFGWNHVVDGGYNAILTGDNISNNVVFNNGINIQNTGDNISNTTVFNNGINNQNTGDNISNATVFNYGVNNQNTGDNISNRYLFYYCTNSQNTGDNISNRYLFYYCTNIQNTGDNISNSSVFSVGVNKILLKNTVLTGNSTVKDSTVNSTRAKASAVLEDCDIDGDRLPFRAYFNSGDILAINSGGANWQAPPSGASWEYEVTPNSYCADTYAGRMELSPMGEIGVWATTTDTSITFKIYPAGWATTLDQADIKIVARYLDAATGLTMTTVSTAAATFANDGWRDLTVAIAPGQDGIVYFQVYIARYEASAYILVDPEWSIN